MSPFKASNSFGSFAKPANFRFDQPKNNFSRSQATPNSFAAFNRQSSYMRWLRGFSIHESIGSDYPWRYPFFFELATGSPSPTGNVPQIPGIFIGFPTPNKELGMHWAGVRLAGSLRTDNLRTTSANGLPIQSVVINQEFFDVILEGNWSESNPLPPPFFVNIPGSPLYPLVGETFEDRILEQNGELITKNSIDPTTGLKLGYVSAVLTEVNPFTGLLRFRRAGSVWTSPDGVVVSPSPQGFTPGRWFSTAARYVCSCQDYLGRDFAWVSRLQREASTGRSVGRYFPYNKPRRVKIGKQERMAFPGASGYNLRAQTPLSQDRVMEVISGTRDAPGVFEDFGATYVNNGASPPLFNDYKTDEQGNVIYEGNFWTYQLDELRYCKHIYAMKFNTQEPIVEPSDYPIGVSVTEIEMAMKREKERTQDSLLTVAEYGIAFSDVPPYNCQSPMMMPAMTKLLNIPSSFIKMSSIVMQDMTTGATYRPSENPGG